jgi:hypothetical protein
MVVVAMLLLLNNMVQGVMQNLLLVLDMLLLPALLLPMARIPCDGASTHTNTSTTCIVASNCHSCCCWWPDRHWLWQLEPAYCSICHILILLVTGIQLLHQVGTRFRVVAPATHHHVSLQAILAPAVSHTSSSFSPPSNGPGCKC